MTVFVTEAVGVILYSIDIPGNRRIIRAPKHVNIASIYALLFFPAFSFQTLKSFQRTAKSLHDFIRSLLLVIERVFK